MQLEAQYEELCPVLEREREGGREVKGGEREGAQCVILYFREGEEDLGKGFLWDE